MEPTCRFPKRRIARASPRMESVEDWGLGFVFVVIRWILSGENHADSGKQIGHLRLALFQLEGVLVVTVWETVSSHVTAKGWEVHFVNGAASTDGRKYAGVVKKNWTNLRFCHIQRLGMIRSGIFSIFLGDFPWLCLMTGGYSTVDLRFLAGGLFNIAREGDLMKRGTCRNWGSVVWWMVHHSPLTVPKPFKMEQSKTCDVFSTDQRGKEVEFSQGVSTVRR